MAAVVCTFPDDPCCNWDHAMYRCLPCFVAFMSNHPAPADIIFTSLRGSSSIEFFESALDVMISKQNKGINYHYDFGYDLRYRQLDPIFLRCGARRATLLHYAFYWIYHIGDPRIGYLESVVLQRQNAIIKRIQLLVERGAVCEFECGCTVESLLEPLKGSQAYDKCCAVLGGGCGTKGAKARIASTKAARQSQESTHVDDQRQGLQSMDTQRKQE